MVDDGQLRLRALSWSEFFEDTVALAHKILSSGYTPGKLVLIARGGLVVGRLLSDLLSVRELVEVHARFYEGPGITLEQPIVTMSVAEEDVRGARLLVVDDIVDTGKTLKTVLEKLASYKPEEVKSAALYVKPWASCKPDFYVKVTNEWLVFPYEIRETLENLPRGKENILKLDPHLLRDIRRIISGAGD